MSDLAALCYADWRSFVNDARLVVRSPGRLILWVLYSLTFPAFLLLRILGAARHGSPPPVTVDARADAIVSALLLVLVYAFASGRGAVGIFRNPTEARFIIGSPVRAPVAIAYLQARSGLAQASRLLVSIVYLVFVFGSRQISIAAALADLVLVFAVATAAAAIVVPRRLLPAPAATACALAGIPLALVAIAPAVRAAVTALPVPAAIAGPIVRFVPEWHPGRVLLEPAPLWIAAAFALAAAAIVGLATVGRDLYPELYALTTAPNALRERLRRRVSGADARVPARYTARTLDIAAPPGVLVFIWRSVVEFRRFTRKSYIGGAAALWCLCGAGFALWSRSDAAPFFVFGGICFAVLLFFGTTTANALGTELRRPLFWLGAAPLFERLAALAAATCWRGVMTLECIAAGVALGGADAGQTLLFALGFPSLVALLTGVGFATFAFFPRAVDERGPALVLRQMLSLFMLVPPLVVFGLGAAFGQSIAALCAATLLAFIEAGMFVGIAAWRLDART